MFIALFLPQIVSLTGRFWGLEIPIWLSLGITGICFILTKIRWKKMLKFKYNIS